MTFRVVDPQESNAFTTANGACECVTALYGTEWVVIDRCERHSDGTPMEHPEPTDPDPS